MAYFIHDGLSFYYEEHGTGPTLIFSHGLGGSSASTRELVVGLAGIRTILYDNRFHGLTNPLRDPGKLNFDQMADDMAAVLDHLEMEHSFVGGSSMGAGIALVFALRHTARARGLVLMRPAWLDRPHPPNLALFPQIADLIEKFGYAGAGREVEKTETFRLWSRTAPATAESVRSVFLDHNPEALVPLYRTMPSSRPVNSLERLRSLSVPTLVLGNRDCPVHPVNIAEELARNIPNSRLEVFPGRSENLEEHLSQFRRVVSEFIHGLT